MCHRREWAQKSESAHKGEGRAGERPARTHVKRTWLKEGGLSSGASAQGPQCLVFGSLLLRHCCTVVTPVYCIADTRNPIKLPTHGHICYCLPVRFVMRIFSLLNLLVAAGTAFFILWPHTNGTRSQPFR